MTESWTRGGCSDIGADLLRGDLPASCLQLAVDGFAALWRGRALPVADLRGNGDHTDAIITGLAARGRAEIDESGRLVGIHGLTLRTTRHRFDHAGRSHNTWCAFDSIGIPAALALDGTAHTDCPTCGRPLTVEVEAGTPTANGFVLWLPSTPGDHLMAEFCASADLYCSVEHLHQRIDTDLVPGTVADLANAAAIGAETWADVAAMVARRREPLGVTIPTDDPRAVAAVAAIHDGDIERMQQLLVDHPELATATLGARQGDCEMTRTLLHVVTDWPGNYPNGAAMVRLLVDAGADVNARFSGPHTETPLHWAASCDDVAVLDALLDAGADIEARGAVIGGGTPISDSTAFGQWKAAHRLLERGASTTFWEAATLGLMDRLGDAFATDPIPKAEDITEAFWGACHGGQLATAEYLLTRGADINWIGWDGLTPLDAAQRSNAGSVASWLTEHDARHAQER